MCQEKSAFKADLEHALLNLPQICGRVGVSSEQIGDKNRKVINFIIFQQVEQCFDRSVIEQAEGVFCLSRQPQPQVLSGRSGHEPAGKTGRIGQK